jgi:hypothetical protein
MQNNDFLKIPFLHTILVDRKGANKRNQPDAISCQQTHFSRELWLPAYKGAMMGYSQITVSIPDKIYDEMQSIILEKKIKLNHLVTEAIADKIEKLRQDEIFLRQVNKAFEDDDVSKEQYLMSELIADSMDMEELPW